MRKDNTIEAFFALVRAGLWETEVQLTSYGEVDYADILRLAQEQGVTGLVAQGIETVQGEWLKVHGSRLRLKVHGGIL